MKPCLILLDGLNIANRSDIGKEILSRFPKDTADRYECTDDTPPHLYVHMMRSVLEGGKSAIIENGWRADALMESLGEKFKSPRQFRRMLDRIALAVNGQIALCIANSHTYAVNWERTHPGIGFGQIAQKVNQLDYGWKRLSNAGLPLTHIWASDLTFKEDIDLLIDRAQLRACTNIGPGIGHWSPGNVVLMVGDRHGPSIQPYQIQYNLAFCDMAKAGASYWLSDKLDEAKIAEDRMYWINAYDKDGQATNSDFVEWLKPIAIFTLGDSAAEWCQTNRLRYEPFAHPQYHKRFQHHQPYLLIERLKQIIGGSQ